MSARVAALAYVCTVACSSTVTSPLDAVGNDSDTDVATTDEAPHFTDVDTSADEDSTESDDDGFATGYPIAAMKPLSFGLAAYASSNNESASLANGTNPAQGWSSESLPAWLAYDMSTIAAEDRHQVLVAWYALHAGDYLNDPFAAQQYAPVDYTIEINANAGGDSPPTSGWTQVESVTGNNRNAAQFIFDLAGANWLRVSVASGSDATVTLNVDVYSAPSGGTDSWLFLGDSITRISLQRAFSDLPALVHAAQADRWPAIIGAGIGGTNTVTAQATIDEAMQGFPGRFVALAYGTNDDKNDFQMETLVQKVLALGKTPVVPHMPWAPDAAHQETAAVINPAIDALYEKYPQILPGPDLYSFFETHPSDIPEGDIHPNAQGQEDLRAQWALTIEAVSRAQ